MWWTALFALQSYIYVTNHLIFYNYCLCRRLLDVDGLIYWCLVNGKFHDHYRFMDNNEYKHCESKRYNGVHVNATTRLRVELRPLRTSQSNLLRRYYKLGNNCKILLIMCGVVLILFLFLDITSVGCRHSNHSPARGISNRGIWTYFAQSRRS